MNHKKFSKLYLKKEVERSERTLIGKKRNVTAGMYGKINDFLSWINPDIMVSLKGESLDNVCREIGRAEAGDVQGVAGVEWTV